MRFGADGIVSGRAGILAGYLGAAKDRGRWSVERDRLCIKWFRWFDAEPRCMTISIDGTRIFWKQDDGDRGTGRVTAHSKLEVARRLGLAEPVPKKVALSKKAAAPKKVAAQKTTVAAAKPAIAGQETGSLAPKTAVPAASAKPNPVPGADAPPQAATATPLETDAAPRRVPTTAATATGGPSFLPSRFAAKSGSDETRVQTASLADAVPRPVPAKRPSARSRADSARLGGPAPAADQAGQSAKAKSKADKRAAKRKAKRKAKRSKARQTFRVVRVDADDLLNVRSGPAEFYEPVGIIPSQGRGVKLTGACVGAWCPIRHHGVRGWVHRHYLAKE